MTKRAQVLQDVLRYAPPEGPVAPDLVGLSFDGGEFLCAKCVGRIIARGCGYYLNEGVQVWTPAIQPPGVSCAGGH